MGAFEIQEFEQPAVVVAELDGDRVAQAAAIGLGRRTFFRKMKAARRLGRPFPTE